MARRSLLLLFVAVIAVLGLGSNAFANGKYTVKALPNTPASIGDTIWFQASAQADCDTGTTCYVYRTRVVMIPQTNVYGDGKGWVKATTDTNCPKACKPGVFKKTCELGSNGWCKNGGLSVGILYQDPCQCHGNLVGADYRTLAKAGVKDNPNAAYWRWTTFYASPSVLKCPAANGPASDTASFDYNEPGATDTTLSTATDSNGVPVSDGGADPIEQSDSSSDEKVTKNVTTTG